MSVVRFPTPAESARSQISAITAAARDRLVREDVVELFTDLLHDYVRDGVGVPTLRIEGLTRAEFEEVDARQIGGWKKRVEIRQDGRLVAAVDFECDEEYTL